MIIIENSHLRGSGVYNVGYMGIGKYKSCINGIEQTSYSKWRDMLDRCYSDNKKRNTYHGCLVDEEWHNYQNFAKWYEDNLWGENFTFLDKDILIKGNKMYSSDTCILVDNRINTLFVKSNKARGLYPIGVSYDKTRNKFSAHCCTRVGEDSKRNRLFLGRFNTPIEAFNAYKQFKESYIKQVADDYANKYPNFPKQLYDAMYNYEVEITD